jgi:hypothetical protein
MKELYEDESALIKTDLQNGQKGQSVTFSVALSAGESGAPKKTIDIEWYPDESGEFAFYDKEVSP